MTAAHRPTTARGTVRAPISLETVLRLDTALAGISYPAEKWELIDHAEHRPAGEPRTYFRTMLLFWALPAGRYGCLDDVLAGAARTVRGHPRDRL